VPTAPSIPIPAKRKPGLISSLKQNSKRNSTWLKAVLTSGNSPPLKIAAGY
jgi:hypothetical protein